jgi:tetratricopeptide (TPR) repeat protein
MRPPISITPQPPRALSLRDECQVQRAALDRDPDSAKVRLRLAALLKQSDDFDAVIELLTADETERNVPMLMLLASACLARKREGDVALALSATQEAMSHADGAAERADAMALHGKALRHAGRDGEAKALWTEALALDPDNRGAFKRLSTRLLREGHAQQALALCDSLIEKGIGHTQLLAAKSVALTALGWIEEAKAYSGVTEFVRTQPITTPEGWESLQSFNADLVAELLHNPNIRQGRYGTASAHSQRIDDPAVAGGSAMAALLEQIAQAATDYAAMLDGIDHPWTAMRPEQAQLRSWCVMTGGDGHEAWHMHPAGWMSGGYYPQVPASVVDGDDPAGCFAIGAPDSIIGADAAAKFGETLIRPQPGLLTLLPSHNYHRTYPHGAVGKRICIAFDICPV